MVVGDDLYKFVPQATEMAELNQIKACLGHATGDWKIEKYLCKNLEVNERGDNT